MEISPDRWNEARFLLGSGCIDTDIWMHYMDANQTAGEETWRQLHNNVESTIEQVLATTPPETPTVAHLPPITKIIQVRRARHAGHCWRSKDELVSDVLLWTPTYDQAKAGRLARTYIKQRCEDTGCNPEDLPEAMNDRSGERGSRISVLTARHDDDDDDTDIHQTCKFDNIAFIYHIYFREIFNWLLLVLLMTAFCLALFIWFMLINISHLVITDIVNGQTIVSTVRHINYSDRQRRVYR